MTSHSSRRRRRMIEETGWREQGISVVASLIDVPHHGIIDKQYTPLLALAGERERPDLICFLLWCRVLPRALELVSALSGWRSKIKQGWFTNVAKVHARLYPSTSVLLIRFCLRRHMLRLCGLTTHYTPSGSNFLLGRSRSGDKRSHVGALLTDLNASRRLGTS